MPAKRPTVLTIAGFDPSGGAGILADIKTFQAFGVQGFAAVTGNTLQTHSHFEACHWTDETVLFRQIAMMLQGGPVAAVKFGLFKNFQILEKCALMVRRAHPLAFLIWDPILKASAGTEFHTEAPSHSLLAYFDLVTPNLPEALALEPNAAEPFKAAVALATHTRVLLKGGHGDGALSTDILIEKGAKPENERPPPTSQPTNKDDIVFFKWPGESLWSIQGRRLPHGKHGSGCTLSAAIAAAVALGHELPQACRVARCYLASYLQSSENRQGVHPSHVPVENPSPPY